MVSLLQKPDYLNHAQWQAVTHPAEHLLITAGPGTGKTHTLVHRIIHASSQLQKGEGILAITFTQKASAEMRQRLKVFSPQSLSSVTACTFHAFCLSCLRAYSSSTRLPEDFRIASTIDIESVAQKCWKEISRKERHQRLQEISRFKNAVLQETPSYLFDYAQQLRQERLLDFDDILGEALHLLLNNKDVLTAIQKRYRHVFVDEYQDINDKQHQMLKLLAQGHVGITAIGDAQQAIYGFRGSDRRFFQEFMNDFSAAAHLSLCENYRSSGNLIEAARQVIAQGPSQDIPPLVAQMHEQGRLIIHESSSDRAEAEYIVHEIEKLVGGISMFSGDSKRVGSAAEAHISFGDVAILCRMKAQRKALEEALHRSGMPFNLSADKPLCEEETVAALLPDLVKRRDNPIEEIREYLASYQEDDDMSLARLKDLAGRSTNAIDFLDSLFLERENETLAYPVEKISLLTLHAAKGLEFPVVFIAGCEEGIVPLVRKEGKYDIEEERRLFYVGMTRAKRILYLTWTRKRSLYGKTQLGALSPFVLDIEERLKSREPSSAKPRKKQNNPQLNFFKNF